MQAQIKDIWGEWKPSTDREDSNDKWCKECEKETVISEDGTYVCIECGCLYGNLIDSSAEWRYYGAEDSRGSDPSRCGVASNYLIPDSNLGTLIGYKSSESYSMKKIRQYHGWNSLNYKGRNLYNQFELLTIRADNNGIPSIIIEHTKLLYKKITDQQLFRGENKNGLMAICMFKACKDKHVPRSIKEIASIFDVDEQVMTKGNRCFTKVWSVLSENEETSEEELQTSLTKPVHYVERFCSRLNLPKRIVDEILFVADIVEKKHMIADNTPSSISTAVIYLVCQINNINISKSEISKVSQISEVTIGKCYKKLFTYYDYIKQELSKRRG
jgi:transcription initiation factor TFIIB